ENVAVADQASGSSRSRRSPAVVPDSSMAWTSVGGARGAGRTRPLGETPARSSFADPINAGSGLTGQGVSVQGTAGGDSPEVAATRPVRQQPQHSPTFASVAGREWRALMAELHGVEDTMPAQQRPSDDALCD